MFQFLSNSSSPDYNEAVRMLLQRGSGSASLKIAVAFWGEQTIDLLFGNQQPPKNCQLICNLESSGTNPWVIEKLINARLLIRSNRRLHAKVLLQDQLAVIGSANLSARALGAGTPAESPFWEEAGIITDEAIATSDAHAWFDELWSAEDTLEIAQADIDAAKANYRKAAPAFSAWDDVYPLRSLENLLDRGKISIALWHDVAQQASDAAKAQNAAQAVTSGLPQLNFYEDWGRITSDWIVDMQVGKAVNVSWWTNVALATTGKLQYVLPLKDHIPARFRKRLRFTLTEKIDPHKLANWALSTKPEKRLIKTSAQFRELLRLTKHDKEDAFDILAGKLKGAAGTGGFIYITNGGKGNPANFRIHGRRGSSGLWRNHLQNRDVQWVMVYHKLGPTTGDVWFGRAAGSTKEGNLHWIDMEDLEGPFHVDSSFENFTGRRPPQNPIYAP